MVSTCRFAYLGDEQVLLYNNLGLTGSVPLLLYAVYLTWAAGLNWVSSMIVDRVGRIKLLIIGIVGPQAPRPLRVVNR